LIQEQLWISAIDIISSSYEIPIAIPIKKETQNELDTKLSEPLCLTATSIQEYIAANEHLIKPDKLKDIELQTLNKKYCQEFADCFRKIPYISQLPTDIYHQIKFKNLSISFIVQIYSYL